MAIPAFPVLHALGASMPDSVHPDQTGNVASCDYRKLWFDADSPNRARSAP